uniref:Uncharacterized protein n=1 Tax=Sus scrofa TaxID=9823 RepID=A0A8D1LPY5_PIG
MDSFLPHFSRLEVGFTSAIAPQVRIPLVTGQGTISRARCFAQTELSFVLGTAESLLRAVMSADRHLASRRALRYPALLSPRLCPVLGLRCWAGRLRVLAEPSAWLFSLPFWGPSCSCDTSSVTARPCCSWCVQTPGPCSSGPSWQPCAPWPAPWRSPACPTAASAAAPSGARLRQGAAPRPPPPAPPTASGLPQPRELPPPGPEPRPGGAAEAHQGACFLQHHRVGPAEPLHLLPEE